MFNIFILNTIYINIKMTHKSEDYKLAAVQYYLVNKEVTRKDICNIFSCSIRSLDRWISLYKDKENLKNKLRDCKAYKVKQEYVDFISNEIENNKTITMKEIQYYLNDKFNIIISRFHVSRIAKDNGFTLKTVKVRHEPITRYNKIINIKSELKVFYEEINKINIDDIICIDETSL
jgi:transposase